jgi:hypothetical protein
LGSGRARPKRMIIDVLAPLRAVFALMQIKAPTV